MPNDDLPTVTSVFKKWIMFGKFTGCKDQQEIQICLYGISKVNCTSYGLLLVGSSFVGLIIYFISETITNFRKSG